MQGRRGGGTGRGATGQGCQSGCQPHFPRSDGIWSGFIVRPTPVIGGPTLSNAAEGLVQAEPYSSLAFQRFSFKGDRAVSLALRRPPISRKAGVFGSGGTSIFVCYSPTVRKLVHSLERPHG